MFSSLMSPAHNGFVTLTSSATPANLLGASMGTKLFQSTDFAHIQAISSNGTQVRDKVCGSSQRVT